MNTGLCGCGCGQKTNIAQRNRKNRGWIKGKPKKFIAGHYNNLKHRVWPQYKVNKSGCWIWQLSLSSDGYASYMVGGKSISGHRYYFEKFIKKIPVKMQLDHLCKVRNCVNPAHLEIVTQTENIRRGKHTKLTKADVRIIRKLYKTKKYLQSDLADEYRVSRSTISHIITNRNWPSV